MFPGRLLSMPVVLAPALAICATWKRNFFAKQTRKNEAQGMKTEEDSHRNAEVQPFRESQEVEAIAAVFQIYMMITNMHSA